MTEVHTSTSPSLDRLVAALGRMRLSREQESIANDLANGYTLQELADEKGIKMPAFDQALNPIYRQASLSVDNRMENAALLSKAMSIHQKNAAHGNGAASPAGHTDARGKRVESVAELMKKLPKRTTRPVVLGFGQGIAISDLVLILLRTQSDVLAELRRNLPILGFAACQLTGHERAVLHDAVELYLSKHPEERISESTEPPVEESESVVKVEVAPPAEPKVSAREGGFVEDRTSTAPPDTVEYGDTGSTEAGNTGDTLPSASGATKAALPKYDKAFLDEIARRWGNLKGKPRFHANTIGEGVTSNTELATKWGMKESGVVTEVCMLFRNLGIMHIEAGKRKELLRLVYEKHPELHGVSEVARFTTAVTPEPPTENEMREARRLIPRLTPSERNILELLAKGLRDEELRTVVSNYSTLNSLNAAVSGMCSKLAIRTNSGGGIKWRIEVACAAYRLYATLRTQVTAEEDAATPASLPSSKIETAAPVVQVPESESAEAESVSSDAPEVTPENPSEQCVESLPQTERAKPGTTPDAHEIDPDHSVDVAGVGINVEIPEIMGATDVKILVSIRERDNTHGFNRGETNALLHEGYRSQRIVSFAFPDGRTIVQWFFVK